MKKLFTTYRWLALVVGVLLLIGCVDAVFKYGYHLVDAGFWAEGSDLQQFAADYAWVWLIHGWIYIVYVVVAFLLSQKTGWPFLQFVLMLVAGLVPGLIFWVERRVAQRVREDYPELAGT